MPDEPDPPRKFYKFKPAEFENINGVRRDDSLLPNQPPPDPGVVQTDKARIDVHDILRAANAAPLASTPAPRSTEPTEVQALLRENHARANRSGLNQVSAAPPRPTRRRRDYFISLAIGNLVLLVATVIQPIYGIAGMIIYNLGLTWIMWFVMEPY